MELNPEELEGRSTEEIIDHLLQYVTKTEDELQEEKEERRRQSTDLKVFISKKEDFELGSVEYTLQKIATDPDTHKYTREFIENHGFTEIVLNDDVSYLEIRTPSYERTDQFILVDKGDYVRTLTVERRHWTKRTIERVIDYLPGLSRLYLTADDIGNIVTDLNEITETNVSGFTSKYRSYKDNSRISIQFHGGDWGDIQHVKEEFQAKPTRVEFRQKNSPTNAVTGSVTRNARINIPGIRAGSEKLGAETLDSLATEFEKLDRQHFDVPNTPRLQSVDGGIVIQGFTTLRLRSDEDSQLASDGGLEEPSQYDSIIEALKKEILESKQRYDFQTWDAGDFLVLDKERCEMIQVGVEDTDLVIHARPGTTSITLKDFCRVILEDFKTTYEIEQRTQNLLQV